jgi:hypothetical protein
MTLEPRSSYQESRRSPEGVERFRYEGDDNIGDSLGCPNCKECEEAECEMKQSLST